MNSHLEPGLYVVAVSGGVDSVALLHMLSQDPGLRLVVAHFDHGIRNDSVHDRELVQDMAQQLGLEFIYETAALGPGTSEATARTARYAFLQSVRQKTQARAIVTAHHQDDVLETAIMSMMRNKGRKGITALDTHQNLARPLLHISKQTLLTYAQQHNLIWREDSTNADTKYLRNYVRHQIIPRIAAQDQQKLLNYIEQLRVQNQQMDTELELLLPKTDHEIDRLWFICLPYDVSTEIMAAWLRKHELRQLSTKLIERLTIVAKTAAPNSAHDIYNGASLQVTDETLALKGLER